MLERFRFKAFVDPKEPHLKKKFKNSKNFWKILKIFEKNPFIKFFLLKLLILVHFQTKNFFWSLKKKDQCMFRPLRNSSSFQNQRKTYKLANGLLQLSGMFIEKFVNFKAPSGINPLPARSPVFSFFLQIMLRSKELPEKGGHWTWSFPNWFGSDLEREFERRVKFTASFFSPNLHDAK